MESSGQSVELFILVTMYWQAECTPEDCVMRKEMTLKKAVLLMMSQESEHWCLLHVQLTLHGGHEWLHCARIKMANNLQLVATLYLLYLLVSTRAVIGQFSGPYSLVQPTKI